MPGPRATAVARSASALRLLGSSALREVARLARAAEASGERMAVGIVRSGLFVMLRFIDGALAPSRLARGLHRWPDAYVRAPRVVSFAVFALASLPVIGSAQIRVQGLSGDVPDRIAIYTVRGAGVTTPLIAFQERARQVVEAHLNAEIVSMDETLARGGPALQKRMAECQGEPKCFAQLLTNLDAGHLMVLTASLVGDLRLLGVRLIDLKKLEILGEAIDSVPDGSSFLDVIPPRIQASVPAARWDPFGALEVMVTEPGAQLSVNGRVVGMSPIRPLTYLVPGTYEVTASKKGYASAKTTVEVARQATARAELSMVALEVEESGSSNWIIWTGVGVVAAGAVAALVVVLATGGGGDPTFCSAPSAAACN